MVTVAVHHPLTVHIPFLCVAPLGVEFGELRLVGSSDLAGLWLELSLEIRQNEFLVQFGVKVEVRLETSRQVRKNKARDAVN